MDFENTWSESEGPAATNGAIISIVRQGEFMNELNEARDITCAESRLADLATHKADEVRQAVAANPSTSPETLRMMAEHPLQARDPNEDWKVLSVVAANPRTPGDVLEALASNDSSGRVYGPALSNPNMPVETLRSFATDEWFGYRQDVARNPSAPEDLLDELANDEYYDASAYPVREAVAANPAVSMTTLTTLLRDGGESVRLTAASNPALPVEAIEQLASMEYWASKGRTEVDESIAMGLVSNPGTPSHVLAQLSGHSSSLVLRRIASTERAPSEVLARLAESRNPMVSDAARATRERLADTAMQAAMNAGAAPTDEQSAGWYPDPSGAVQQRYWDGGTWTTETRLYPPPG